MDNKIKDTTEYLKKFNLNETYISNLEHEINNTQNVDIEKIIKYKKIKRINETIKLAIGVLPEQQGQIILDYYINNKSWFNISIDLHISDTWCKQLRNKAIKSISYCLFGGDD